MNQSEKKAKNFEIIMKNLIAGDKSKKVMEDGTLYIECKARKCFRKVAKFGNLRFNFKPTSDCFPNFLLYVMKE
ncbi:abc transporter substrate-binding protein [Lasius niger]|uniref:Abc transporter substrate-binding protein n=1 Tax=Lasius niger TaxID=67767 RepID=A0A0J7KQZ5_LASNI|nr:abc transporter substrate-binding protein [Lasius niger]